MFTFEDFHHCSEVDLEWALTRRPALKAPITTEFYFDPDCTSSQTLLQDTTLLRVLLMSLSRLEELMSFR